MLSPQDLLAKASGSIGAGDFITASGMLNPEQATKFLDLAYDASPLNQAIRAEKRHAQSGTIAKLGIGSRILRKGTSGVSDGTITKPGFSDVAYQCVNSRADTMIENSVLRYNIEGAGFEDHWVGLLADQVGRDLEDIHLNGDTTDTSSDADFLTQNEGWLRQLILGNGSDVAHRINGAATNSGNISKDHFHLGVQGMPSKYQNGRLRWLLSPITLQRYLEYLSNRGTPAGDAVLVSGNIDKILGIPFIEVPRMPNGRILLTDPQNLIAVNTFDVQRAKTSEGIEAVGRDVTYYVWRLDDDPIIETQDAVVDIYGLAA